MRVVQPIFRASQTHNGKISEKKEGEKRGNEQEQEENQIGEEEDLVVSGADEHGTLYRSMKHDRAVKMLQEQFVEDFSPVSPDARGRGDKEREGKERKREEGGGGKETEMGVGVTPQATHQTHHTAAGRFPEFTMAAGMSCTIQAGEVGLTRIVCGHTTSWRGALPSLLSLPMSCTIQAGEEYTFFNCSTAF